MPIGNILKALRSEDIQKKADVIYEDNEVLFCKNNVCVHPPALIRQDSDILHYPGYLTVTTKTFIDQYNNVRRPTLLLTWIPNSTLRKCPSTVENCITMSSLFRQNSEELKQSGTGFKVDSSSIANGMVARRGSIRIKSSNPFIEPFYDDSNDSHGVSIALNNSGEQIIDSCEKHSRNSVYNKSISCYEENDTHSASGLLCNELLTRNIEPEKSEDIEEIQNLKNELEPLLSDDPEAASASSVTPLLSKKSITSVNITIADPCIQNVQMSSHDAESVNHSQKLRSLSVNSVEENSPNWMSPELLAYKHNLYFPDSASASPVVSRKAIVKCRRFSVDLSQMRSLRLFFNDENCTSGQLVIASRESQYKILHFHHGGLDHLAQVLHQWHCLLHNIKLGTGQEEANLPYRQFMVCRPEVKKSELHPDEGNVYKITTNYFYGTLLNNKGQVEDDLLLRKAVFFGGLEKSLRKTVWPLLLHCYSFNTTFDERATLMEVRKKEYGQLTRRRVYSMSPEKQSQFWRNVQCIVEKDVVRTDRGNPFFAGEDNPNIEIMKNILLNYAFYNTGISYTQGMSDLLAPVFSEIKNESETFWCFVGLMQQAIFVCTPTDNDIDKNLSCLRELIRVMIPKFYQHLKNHTDAMELLFCHRWLLLCFKREFTEAVAIRMWEACWSNYLTDYFHLFLCLAIVAVYADDVIAQNLRTDEMLLHFSSLAMYMDGQLILRKARGLLHQYRQLPRIPCTLAGLCERCGPGMWDSGHHPAIECVGHTDEERCSIAAD